METFPSLRRPDHPGLALDGGSSERDGFRWSGGGGWNSTELQTTRFLWLFQLDDEPNHYLVGGFNPSEKY